MFRIRIIDRPVDNIRRVVVRLRDGRRGERVGLDDVGARLQHLAVDLPYDVWPRQTEDVVVALEVLGAVLELGAPEVFLPQAAPLGGNSIGC